MYMGRAQPDLLGLKVLVITATVSLGLELSMTDYRNSIFIVTSSAAR